MMGPNNGEADQANIRTTDKKLCVAVLAVQAGLFLFLVWFFDRWCPLVPYDSDDWLYPSGAVYLSDVRVLLPAM